MSSILTLQNSSLYSYELSLKNIRDTIKDAKEIKLNGYMRKAMSILLQAGNF